MEHQECDIYVIYHRHVWSVEPYSQNLKIKGIMIWVLFLHFGLWYFLCACNGRNISLKYGDSFILNGEKIQLWGDRRTRV